MMNDGLRITNQQPHTMSIRLPLQYLFMHSSFVIRDS